MSDSGANKTRVEAKDYQLLKDVVRPGETSRGEFIPGIEALDPSDKRSAAFLADKSPTKVLARNILRQRLMLLRTMLKASETDGDVLTAVQGPLVETQVAFKKNLEKIYEETRDLEIAYRTLGEMMRSASAGQSQDLQLYVLNMAAEDIVKSHALAKDLRTFVLNRSDALKKDNAFTAIVAPGGATSPEVIEELGKLGEQANLVVFTDVPDLPDIDRIKHFLNVEMGNPSGSENFLNHVALFGNYPRIAHSRDKEGGEGMFVPPTAFVAGRYYNNAVSGNLVDSVAGLKSRFKNATGVRVFLNQTNSAEAGLTTRFRMNPIISEGHDQHDGAVAFGHMTLCDRDGTCLYPITYTKTYIGRCIAHRLALFQFRRIDDDARRRMERTIQDFLNQCMDRKWIENGTVSVKEDNRTENAFKVILKLKFAPFANAFNLQVSAELQQSGEIHSSNIE